MFCPKCSQPQVSDEVRFCSRCGLPLASVVALLASKEVMREGEDAEHHSERSRRQAGIRRGAKILFFSVVLFPFFFSICMFFHTPAPLVVPASVFLVGLAMLIYAALFGDELLAVRGFRSPRELPEGLPKPALAAPLFSPATGVNPQRVSTSEIKQPVSITEHTTKLLAKDRE